MKCRHATAVCASVLGLLAFVVLSPMASAKTVKSANKTSAIEMLESAHHLLASADHDYDGRRAKAMEEIKKAIHELRGGKEKTGTSTGTTGTAAATVKAPKVKVANAKAHVKESQAASDAKLREALSMISGVESQLGSHHKASSHVSAAVGHLNAALHTR